MSPKLNTSSNQSPKFPLSHPPTLQYGVLVESVSALFQLLVPAVIPISHFSNGSGGVGLEPQQVGSLRSISRYSAWRLALDDGGIVWVISTTTS